MSRRRRAAETGTGKINGGPKTDSSQPLIYRIRVSGHLGSQWASWFEDLTVTWQDNGETLLTGPVVDQAALHGLLKKVRDLGMTLISVTSSGPAEADARMSRKDHTVRRRKK